MDDSINIVNGQASLLTLQQVHHGHGLVAPIVPRHLVEELSGDEENFCQVANFPWSPMACYVLMPESGKVPAEFLERGMRTDYFGCGARSNGYSDFGGIVVCSGGIFLSQQNVITSGFSSDAGLAGYTPTMEAYNMHLAPLMNRQNRRPSVGMIYSEYRRDFCLFSTIPESWGASSLESDRHIWDLATGWGMVGEITEDNYIGWLHVVLAGNFSTELSAACRYLLAVGGETFDNFQPQAP